MVVGTFIGERIEKNSRFIGISFSCSSILQFQKKLEELKNTYSDASHIVYAYNIIEDGTEKVRFNDDGEPSGTAGKPLLNHFFGMQLVNTVIFVVRYFGGVKLGASGLVRAYSNAASDVLKLSVIEDYIEYESHLFTFEYSLQNKIDQLLKLYQITQMDSQYAEQIEYKVTLPKDQLSDLKKQLESVLQGFD